MSSDSNPQLKVAHDLAPTPDRLRTRTHAACIVCGEGGKPLYEGLRDQLFGVEGDWNISHCPHRECGLIWLDPMPIEEDIAKAYQRYYTHKDATESHSPFARTIYRMISEGYLASKYCYGQGTVGFWQRTLSLLIYLHPPQRSNLDFSVMYLPANPGGRVLEVGPGAGRNLARLQELGWQCEGVDFDSSAVRNARAKGLRVHEGTLEAQRFAGDHFDAIISSHVIEHVYDPRDLLRECYRILKPRGMLVVVTPNSASLGHSMYRSNWRGIEPPRHLHLFNRGALRRVARDAGFLTVGITTTIHGANWVFAASEEIAARRRAGRWRVPGRLVRHWALGMQVIEWILLSRNRFLGEELLLLARK